MGYMTKPVNTLIEKISAAIGAIFIPWQMMRVAKAKAKADKIHAVAQAEVDKIHAIAQAEVDKVHAVAQIEIIIIQRRAMVRFFAKEANKQSNIKAITRKALPTGTT